MADGRWLMAMKCEGAMASDCAPTQPGHRALVLETYKPAWRQRKLIPALVVGVLGVLAFNAYLVHIYLDSERTDPGLPLAMAAVNAVFFGAWCVDGVWLARRARSRSRGLRARAVRSPHEELELGIHDLALRGNNDIPHCWSRCRFENPPDAVFVGGPLERYFPTPRTSAVPFEPIPLGQDRPRSATLLEHFVGWRPAADTGKIFGRLLRRLPPTRTWLTFFGVVLVLATWRLLVGGVGCWPFVVAVIVLGLPAAVSFLMYEARAKPCWLFPGVIAVKTNAAPGDEDLVVSRRGGGTLWYDAFEELLYLPQPGGERCKVKCAPLDGLLAVWAWLNTAEPPHEIHLDHIA